MTDWLPVVGVALAGILATLGLLLKGLRADPVDVDAAQRMLWVTVAATALLYALYLVFGERWLWYG